MRLKRFLQLIALVSLFWTPFDASARNARTVTATRLSNVTANTACDANIHLVDTPACRSFEAYVTSGDSMRVSVTWDQTAGSDLTVWIDTSPDGTVPWSIETLPVTNSAGVVALKPQSLVLDASADGSASFQFSSFTSVMVRFRFVWTGGGASDLFSVTTQHR